MFVEYLFMDKYGSSVETKEIDHKDPTMVDLIEGSVGFRFCEIVSETPTEEIDGVEFTDVISKKQSNWYYSNWYYDGIKMTDYEIIEQYGSDATYSQLIKYIKEHNIKSICVTPLGNFIKMNDDDVLISDLKLKKM